MTAALSTSRLRTVDLDQARFLSRWLKVWIVLLAVVVLVVVLYLIFITDSLASINGNLHTADSAVTGAGGHVQTLPGQIQQVNTSLTSIDTALKPITGQATQIIAGLTSINTSLVSADGSLKDTSASLVNTSGSLVNTSSVLQSVLAIGQNINTVLNQANLPNGNGTGASQLGVQNIWQRVDIANGVLTSARADTQNVADNQAPAIVGQLKGICNGPTLALVDSAVVAPLVGVNGHRAC
jgi:cell division protein FtsL